MSGAAEQKAGGWLQLTIDSDERGPRLRVLVLPALGVGRLQPAPWVCPDCGREQPPTVDPLMTRLWQQQGREGSVYSTGRRCDPCARRGFRRSRSQPDYGFEPEPVFAVEPPPAAPSPERQAELLEERIVSQLLLAGVPHRMLTWTFDTYPVQGSARLRSAREWVNRPERDLVLFGPCGTGKTGIGVSMLRALLTPRQDRPLVPTVRMVSADDVLREIRASYAKDSKGPSEHTLILRLTQPDVLLLDDVSITQPSPHSEQILHAILRGRRDANRPTILSMNYELGETDQQQQSSKKQLVEALGAPTIDRLRESAWWWRFKGESLRKPLIVPAPATILASEASHLSSADRIN